MSRKITSNKNRKQKQKVQIPAAMRVQFSRLFGENSKEAKLQECTEAEFKRALKKMLAEIDRYFEANVETDEMHTLMLYTGLWAASESLSEEDFLLGYIEGITRFCFLLLGDYPDHRKRKGGKRQDTHYDLQRMRSLIYTQDSAQKMQTLLAAPKFGLPKLKQNPREALTEFRRERGFKASYKEFIRWFREKYPEDYASLF